LTYLTDDIEERVETERVKTMVLSHLSEEIKKLSTQRKKVLQFYFFENKSTSEIAEILGLATQTVLNHKTQAIAELRKQKLRFNLC
jgi:RNA polymerase sigma factor (sigma-70 family)